MSMQNMSKSVVRSGKNYLKGFTNTQVKVRDATSNDPWGPSGTQMNELAQLSYNQNDFIEMMEIMDKRLNDKGKNWRHVFKTLTLLDYLLHAGSENVVIYFRDNIYIVKTLKEFQYVDDYGKDQGANVRQKAKDITNLLQDEARLREARRSRAHMRDRMTDGPASPTAANGNGGDFEDEEGRRRRRMEAERRRAGQNRENDELQRAIEESKRMARENEERIRAESKDEEELQRALALSREEEERRIKELEKKNETALFDDDFNLLDGPGNQYAQQQQQQQQPQQQVDMWGNPIYGMQQPQYTAFNPYLQQQQTSFNPFFQQQMALQAQQEQEYQRQMELQAQAQQYQHLMTQQQPLQPQPTAFGSNNPFAFQQQQQQQSQQQQLPPRQPQLQMSTSVPTADLLGEESQPQQQQQPQQPQQQQQQPQAAQNKFASDPRFKELDRMLASGDGIDTFGNTGDLRMGHSAMRVQAQQTGAPRQQQQQQQPQPTGNNPFFQV
ncbi:ENTH-domain-containing protein [Acaromyces ingoldii]|uniref:ENTH-domain-containing protein n=1 Tax=Acaromyces ingoldii TaxID=215250 RepID=A0A316YFE4_9BASI|nr:ENTH-domain-containing protein [Acaromyces ingoldii]PWN87912.1 ENTH-domain-containing protein [Acaromyces ingoldii]